MNSAGGSSSAPRKPRILCLSMEAPRMPGTGGQVRTWFFAKFLAGVGELTLISLGGCGGNDRVGGELRGRCSHVIESGSLPRLKGPLPGWRGRLASWARTLGVLCFPWRHQWSDFLGYCLQHTGQGAAGAGNSPKWRKRILSGILGFEYRVAARHFPLPPLTTFLFRRNFDAVRSEVSELLERESFDILWFEHSLMYPFAAEVRRQMPDAVMVCNAHNVESLLHTRMAEKTAGPAERDQARMQAGLLATMEREAFAACDLVLVCSGEDKIAAQQLAPACRVEVMGNGVDVDYFKRPPGTLKSAVPTLLFTGGFGYGPNRDGLRYLVEEILPLIHAHQPGCRLVFAGADAEEAARGLGVQDARISWVSNPPDIRPCFHEAWVAVVPLRSGGGTRLKILEAMAMECPVVSTTIGAEGIPLEADRHGLIADHPEEFAAAVIRLLSDTDTRERMTAEALTFVRSRYDWGTITRDLPDVLRQRMGSLHPRD